MHNKISRRMSEFRNYQNMKRSVGESYSTNIYEQIKIESLRHEYDILLEEILDYSKITTPMKYLNPLDIGKDYRARYTSRCKGRIRAIKQIINGYIASFALRSPDFTSIENIADDFDLVWKYLKNEPGYYRIRSIYSYDIMENPTYIKANKVAA